MTNEKPRDESVQTTRFRIEPGYKGYRHFAVYDGDDLVCVAVYRKGAEEVIRRLSTAVHPEKPQEVPSPK